MNYMGIDHHMQYSHITLLDEKGEKLKSGRVANLRSELEDFLSCIEEGNRGRRWRRYGQPSVLILI